MAVLVTQLLVSAAVAWAYAQSKHSPQRYEWWWTPFWLTPEIILVAGFALKARQPSGMDHPAVISTDTLILAAAFLAALTALPFLAVITKYAVMNGAPS
jgi:hypothetical protein